MTTARSKQRASPTRARAGGPQSHIASVVRRLTSAFGIARSGAARAIEQLPGTVRATRASAHTTTSALQALPDSTLRWLAASSVGLSTGLRLAGAPRLAVAAGAAPALLIGAAIVMRPAEPEHPARRHAAGSKRGDA